jgi:very-short-patch-repair endonuclease
MIELDGRAFHDTDRAFERDRARDRCLAVAGWLVIRVTWQQLESDPAGVLHDLRALLDSRASSSV